MSNLFAVALVLSSLNYGITMATASSDESFFQKCPASSCSEGGPEIRFPFRLVTSPLSCGAPGMELVCSKADTILVHPNLGLCKVIAIGYRVSTIIIVPLAESKCPFQKIISTNLSTDVYSPYGDDATLVSCSAEFIPSDPASIAGPISCLDNTSQFTYYMLSSSRTLHLLPIFLLLPVSNSTPSPSASATNAPTPYGQLLSEIYIVVGLPRVASGLNCP
ncbi:rust resistance kinase Lr10-like [Miscanthus floridulus]|uniref:rust resistance kinase Lr10-like n=1 Tax=Miscanthus floridulus TaxID=154761 RepID=UPI003457FB80